MGDPRRLKKKYKTPNSPYEKVRLVEELELLGKFGLRNKRELRRHKFALSHFRQLARENRSLPEKIQKIRFVDLRDSVAKLNLVSEDGSTDDILSLTIENILERRLQTFVFKIGLAK
ncbi:MAG: 30S ribosomal protein S4, partial [Promethearchaeota archaeon]